MRKNIKRSIVVLALLFTCFMLPVCKQPSGDSDAAVKRIKVKDPPDKRVYIKNESFLTDGMVIMAYYDDNTSAPVTDYTFEPSRKLKLTDEAVTITYQKKTVTLDIIVIEDGTLPESISIEEFPERMYYQLHTMVRKLP